MKTIKDKKIPKEEKPIVDEKILIGNADAKVWAEEFVKLCQIKPSVAIDKETMIGWFANAIMAGYDLGKKHKGDDE